MGYLVSDDAKQVGQDRPYKEATDLCKAKHGNYINTAKGGHPRGPGPGPLPNQPKPFVLKG